MLGAPAEGPGRAGSRGPTTLDLLDERASDPRLSGRKAAALASAARLRLPVLPGFVITTAADVPDLGEIRPRWRALSDDGARPLVVRSSSTLEDDLDSSMAGRFLSVVGVEGWDAFVEAVSRVLDSAGRTGDPEPMAVLVQPRLDASIGGVMFGLDPVTGDRRRIVVEAVEGGPERLVSGVATASRSVLSHRGRLVERDRSRPSLLRRNERRRLARLARQTDAAFGGPQDVEWAFDRRGRLWLFQSRPITATGDAAMAAGPVLGPGPIGETFPHPLRPLEEQLWLEPLRAGLVSALRSVGATSRRRIDGSPVLLTVGGWAAADLELLGTLPRRRSPWRLLNPVPPARHLAVAWRVGRLRRCLQDRARPLVAETDRRLAEVPGLDRLSDLELRWILARVRQELVAVHAHEVLAGMLLHEGDGHSAEDLALGRLAAGRAAGLGDGQIASRWPEVLALVPPRLGPLRLPDIGAAVPPATPGAMGDREALRLRTRWLQELAARAAWALGRRMRDAGRLPSSEAIAYLSLEELDAVLDGRPAPEDLQERMGRRPGAPLPATFRLTASGEPIPVRSPGRLGTTGIGAAEGRAVGRVHQLSEGPPREGEILVVRVLDPGLAASLPSIEGLVSETGSTLSHLAILAREVHVPTVVGFPQALESLPPGALVLIDGTTGEVSLLDQEVPT
jgi:pyruvate,water dikinase